jgi:hypothetical protein
VPMVLCLSSHEVVVITKEHTTGAAASITPSAGTQQNDRLLHNTSLPTHAHSARAAPLPAQHCLLAVWWLRDAGRELQRGT